MYSYESSGGLIDSKIWLSFFLSIKRDCSNIDKYNKRNYNIPNDRYINWIILFNLYFMNELLFIP